MITDCNADMYAYHYHVIIVSVLKLSIKKNIWVID